MIADTVKANGAMVSSENPNLTIQDSATPFPSFVVLHRNGLAAVDDQGVAGDERGFIGN
jgi:hypothetical protein